MKKKIVSVLLSLCLCCSMTACSGSSDSTAQQSSVSESSQAVSEESSANTESEESELSAEKNLLSVEVTIPASLLDDSDNTELPFVISPSESSSV